MMPPPAELPEPVAALLTRAATRLQRADPRALSFAAEAAALRALAIALLLAERDLVRLAQALPRVLTALARLRQLERAASAGDATALHAVLAALDAEEDR
jgi:hypothetical protein